MPLGNDLRSKLETSILYTRVDPSSLDHTKELIIKFDVEIKEFNRLTNNGADIDTSWLSSLVAQFDPEYDASKPLNLMTKTIKDSVYDSKSVTVMLIKYSV